MNIEPIASIKTCYQEKFGVPRQPGLVSDAWGQITFEPHYRDSDAVRGLEGFSHLWVIFVFHQTSGKQWKPSVRPPRLGGNKKMGVFASRSPFRPNPIGLSCLEIERIDYDNLHGPVIHVRGVDLVDGTPIIDIKPYVPYADSIAQAIGGFAQDRPQSLHVCWRNNSDNAIDSATKQLIEKSLSLDPRPAYQQNNDQREYGCLIARHNIKWIVKNNVVLILTCSSRAPDE